MSIQLHISAKETKTAIVIYDCTGNGKYGWSNQTVDIKTVTLSQFEIYPPQTKDPIIIPCFPDFPNIDENLGFEIPVSSLGMASLESGVWKIGFRVIGNSKGVPYEYYNESKFIFTESAECCVDKLRSSTANVPVNVFMKDEKKRSSVELTILLQDALWAKECGKYDAAQTILKFINLQCECC